MGKLLIKALLPVFVLGLMLPAGTAFAEPYVSINVSGNNSLNITVSGGNYNQSVDLVYTLPGSSLPTVISNIGTTSGGYWNGVLNLTEYGIVSGSQVYVKVGGQQSNMITVNYGGGYYGGCTYNCGSPTGLSLSQNSVSLAVGQSQTVSAYPYTGSGFNANSIYISSNSNSSIVSATVSGTQINLYGLANGTSTVNVCATNNNYSYNYGSNCAGIYVTVTGSVAGSGNYSVSIRDNFYSPQVINISAGTTITWRNDGSNTHNVVFDNLGANSGTMYSGNTYILSFSQPGTYTYHCTFHSGMTGTVVVGGSGSGSNTGNITFSPSNPTMSVGQDLAVSINSYAYNNSYAYGNNTYYISSNSNSNVASASVSGTALNLHAYQAGNSTITVCHSSLNFCGTLYVSVSGGSSVGNITFSPQNPNLGFNQSMTVSIYGGTSGSYYISSNSNSNVVTASVSGNNLYLYGKNYGSSAISVCQSGYSACGTLYVNVGGGGYGGSLSLSQTSLNLSPYQSAAVTIYGSGNYYISSNSNPNAASATVSGNSVNVYAYASGSSSISVCQNYNSQCATLQVSVGGSSYGGDIRISNTTLPSMVLGQYYSQQLNAVGGIPPYNFTLNSGALPAGLNLSAQGQLYGTPQYAYTGNFSVKVTDNQGRSGVTPFTISGSGSTGSGVLGVSTYKSGQLIKENNTIYIVYRGLKNGFANWNTFSGFGFSLNNVLEVGNSGLADSGYTLSTSNASHPWGSWVKSGTTVYFVHETGLIPVPDWNTFLNNNGQASWIVTANWRDLQLPRLSPMVYSDARVN